jgi:type II secretory pathway pseudopilin PulG
MYRRAESSLNAVVRNAQRDFDRSAELREALAAEQRAYDALQAARREALRDVVENPKYQALQDLRSNLSEKIADRREGARDGLRDTATTAPATRLVSTTELPPRYELSRDRDGDVVAIATLKLRVGTDARSMERDALDGNDKIRRAREDLASASTKVTDLRDKFDDSLRNNDDMKQARGELEEARIARVTTATYLLGAREAAEEALQFAYWVHRYDYNRYNYSYYGGYPYGYGHHSYGVGYRPSRMVP